MSIRFLNIVTTVLLLLNVVELHGQKIDSTLQKELATLTNFEKVEKLTDLCWQNREKDSDKAIEFALMAIDIAKAEGYNKQLGVLYNYIGVVYQHYKGDLPRAIAYYNDGLSYSLQTNDSIEIAYVYNNLGDAFYGIGNVSLAFEYAEKSKGIFERIGDQVGIAYSYVNLGSLNRVNKDFDVALEYFEKAIEIRETMNDSVGLASANYEVAQTKFLMGKVDEAMICFQESLEKNTQLDNKTYMVYSMQGIGDVYMEKNQYDSAYYYFDEALKFSKERNNLLAQINCQIGKAKALGGLGKKDEGLTILNDAMQKALKADDSQTILYIYKIKGAYFYQYENYKEAAEYYQKYLSVYDSLYTEIQFQTLSEVKRRFEIVEQLDLANKDIRTRQRVLIFALAVIILLTVFAALIVFRNKKIIQLSSQLRESNQSKDKVFSIISHDLISPFNALLGGSEMLMDSLNKNDLEGAKMSGKLIQRASEEGYYFVSNLLHWARTQRRSIKVIREEFKVKDLFTHVRSSFNHQVELKSIQLTQKVDGQLVINADRQLLQIILVNLINNAIKFTHKNGSIEISATKEIQSVKISVKDNGVGISSDRLSNIFVSKDMETTIGTDSEKGTGLGLMLCKELVEMQGGKIYVDSVVDEGTEFWFTIPL